MESISRRKLQLVTDSLLVGCVNRSTILSPRCGRIIRSGVRPYALMLDEVLPALELYIPTVWRCKLRQLCVTVVLLVFTVVLGPPAAPAQDVQQEHYVSPWKTPWTFS